MLLFVGTLDAYATVKRRLDLGIHQQIGKLRAFRFAKWQFAIASCEISDVAEIILRKNSRNRRPV
jgi:hypothetical protein